MNDDTIPMTPSETEEVKAMLRACFASQPKANGVYITSYPVPALYRPQGARQPSSWADVTARLASPLEARSKECLPGWSLATFADDYREKTKVQEVFALGFDVDEAPHCTLDELRAALAPYAAVVHSTYSHTPDAPRWRIMVRASRPVTGAEYERAWVRFRTTVLASVGVGPQAKDPSRFWYQPGRAPGAPYEYATTDGAPVDVDALLAELPPDPPQPPPPPPPAPPSSNRPDIVARARAWLARAEAAVSGERGSPVAFRTVERVVRGFELSDAEAFDALRDWNKRCLPPWDPSPDARAEDSLPRLVRRARADGDTPIGSLRDEAPKAKSPEAPTLTERVRGWRAARTSLRFELGFPTHDVAHRGGYLAPRVVVVGGAPGAAKTTLVVNALVRAAIIGHPAAMLASDEDVDDILVRVGQLRGISRTALESAEDEATSRLCTVLAELPHLAIFDGDETTVEDVFDWLDAHALPGVPGVFVGDSVQTMRTARSKDLETRHRIDDVMQTVKQRTRRGKLDSIVTSEIGRGFYRSVKALEDLNDLAAFKESGGIEYAAKTAMVMRSHPGADDLFDVGMPKNRGGKKRLFRLQLDEQTTMLREVEIPADEDAQAGPSRDEKKVHANAERVYKVVAKIPGVGTRKLRLKLPGMGVPAVDKALDALEEAGRIVNRPETHGQRQDPHYFVVAAEPETPEPEASHWTETDADRE